MNRQDQLKKLQVIPGIAKKLSQTLLEIDIKQVSDLKGKDPQALYDKLTALRGKPCDRCVLYVFREAVYFAEHKKHNPEKLKWWNWKDKK